jgi:F-type H+-transporting ATPase subunit alpha
VGGKAQLKVFREVSGALKLAYSQFEELESFARFGARLDDNSQKIIERGQRIRAFLQQPESSPIAVAAQITILLALINGLFDSVTLLDIQVAQQELSNVAYDFSDDLTQRINSPKTLSDDDKQYILKNAEKALLRFLKPVPFDALKTNPTSQKINPKEA